MKKHLLLLFSLCSSLGATGINTFPSNPNKFDSTYPYHDYYRHHHYESMDRWPSTKYDPNVHRKIPTQKHAESYRYTPYTSRNPFGLPYPYGIQHRGTEYGTNYWTRHLFLKGAPVNTQRGTTHYQRRSYVPYSGRSKYGYEGHFQVEDPMNMNRYH